MKKALLVIITLVMLLIMAACDKEGNASLKSSQTAQPTLHVDYVTRGFRSLNELENYIFNKQDMFPNVDREVYISPKEIVGEFDLPLDNAVISSTNRYNIVYYTNKDKAIRHMNDLLFFTFAYDLERYNTTENPFKDSEQVKYFDNLDEAIAAEKEFKSNPNVDYIPYVAFMFVKKLNGRDLVFSINDSEINSVAFYNNGYRISIEGLRELDDSDPNLARLKALLDPEKYEETIALLHGGVEKHIQELKSQNES